MAVSKSQLAIEYSYRIRDEHPETWIFWVHASNAARFEESFHEIADRLKIPNRQDAGANIFALVYDWLQSNENWMVILDNLDDDGFLHERRATGHGGQQANQSSTTERPLASFLPRGSKGTMVITTRSRDCALRIVDYNKLIEVPPMNTADAVALLRTKLQLPAEEINIAKLARALDHMPLAIVQASAYIRRRLPRYSASRFLCEFQGSDERKLKLLSYEAGHSQRDRDATNSILLSWQMSFDHLQTIRSSAADLLSVMSFFDPNGVSEDLLRLSSESATWPAEDGNETQGPAERAEAEYYEALGFSDDIALLKDFSFISIHQNTQVFMMHRLVQLATRQWLENRGESEKWRERFIRILSAKFQLKESEHWAEYLSLSPHLKSALAQRPRTKAGLQKWASLLNSAAVFVRGRCFFADANKMATASMEARQILFGTEHPDTLQSMFNLAFTYFEAGRWQEAETLHLRVLEARKRILHEHHPDIINSMSTVAIAYWQQFRWQEARELQVQVIELRQAVLGVDHPTTLGAIQNLGSMYQAEGQLRESERLMKYVLDIRKKTLGAEHSSTVSSMTRLAITYRQLGQLSESEGLFVQALEHQKIMLGREHPDTLTSMINLALTYQSLGQPQRSEALLVQVVEIQKNVLGVEHPRTIRGMSTLACIYQNQGRLAEAENLALQVLQHQKRVHGAEHFDTLSAMSYLALIYQDQNRQQEAISLQVQSLALARKAYGPENLQTLKIMAETALLWKDQGESTKASSIMSDCVAAQTRILGSDHPDTARNSETLVKWKFENLQLDAKEADSCSIP